MTPCPCTTSRARHSCLPITTVASSGSVPRRSSSCASDQPSTYSVVMKRRPAASPMSWVRTTCACEIRRVIRTSWRKRSSAAASSLPEGARSSLSATTSSSSRSRAAYTIPMPPAPSTRSISYRPASTSPAARAWHAVDLVPPGVRLSGGQRALGRDGPRRAPADRVDQVAQHAPLRALRRAPLLLEQQSLARDAPPIPARVAVPAHHAMAWDHQCDGIRGARARHRARRAGLADGLRHRAIAPRLSVGNGAQRLPYTLLELCRLHVERQVEPRRVAGEVPEQGVQDRKS